MFISSREYKYRASISMHTLNSDILSPYNLRTIKFPRALLIGRINPSYWLSDILQGMLSRAVYLYFAAVPWTDQRMNQVQLFPSFVSVDMCILPMITGVSWGKDVSIVPSAYTFPSACTYGGILENDMRIWTTWSWTVHAPSGIAHSGLWMHHIYFRMNHCWRYQILIQWEWQIQIHGETL